MFQAVINTVGSWIFRMLNNNFDSKVFLTMVIVIVTIVGIITIFSLKSDKKVITPAIQIREGLRDIVN